MVLLDISATGEENLIEQQSGDPMNDLEYRRRQLLKLQDAVIDLEDLSSGVSIADLTLTDFRIDLADYRRDRSDTLDRLPLGVYAVTTAADAETPPGMIFCLRAEGPTGMHARSSRVTLSRPTTWSTSAMTVPCCSPSPRRSGYWIASGVSVGAVRSRTPAPAHASTAITRGNRDMRHAQRLLAAAVASVAGKHEERARLLRRLIRPTTGGSVEFPGPSVATIQRFRLLSHLS